MPENLGVWHSILLPILNTRVNFNIPDIKTELSPYTTYVYNQYDALYSINRSQSIILGIQAMIKPVCTLHSCIKHSRIRSTLVPRKIVTVVSSTLIYFFFNEILAIHKKNLLCYKYVHAMR